MSRLETKRLIRMRKLKDFAFEKLPKGSALRDVLLAAKKLQGSERIGCEKKL